MGITFNKLKIILKNNVFFIGYFVVCLLFFILIFKLNIPTDIQLHISILKNYITNGYFPDPPVYFISIHLLNLCFQNNYIDASIIILTFACIIKFVLVKGYLSKDLSIATKSSIDFFTFSLMFLSPIIIPSFDNGYSYVGRFTSSIWHNSTTIFVFPLSIWLFIQSLSYIENPRIWTALKLLIISIIIILSKPSFLFVFVFAFPIICLKKFKWKSRWFLFSSLLCILLILLLVGQKTLIYNDGPLDKLIYNGERSHIIIAPFRVWLLWSKYPLYNLITSFAFILSFIILKWRKCKSDLEIMYSLLLLLGSLSVFFIFAESGPRLKHGNFYWQIPISMLIVNMILLKKTFFEYFNHKVENIKLSMISKPDKIILFFYMLQFFSGIYYVVKIITTKSYF